MKKYKGLICFPMWQEVIVEAENEDEAFDKVCDASDFSKSSLGDPHVGELEEMEGESK
jgi:hypothetical protein